MNQNHLQLGRLGEELACHYLENQGYTLIERNFRCPFGEMDLILKTEEYLVFCEVKTRKNSSISPLFSVTKSKQKKLWELVSFYEQTHGFLTVQPRIDVIAIQIRKDQNPQIEHIVNAINHLNS